MRIISLNVSIKKGTKKTPVKSVEVIENHGFKRDAHSGTWLMQVSLPGIESIKNPF